VPETPVPATLCSVPADNSRTLCIDGFEREITDLLPQDFGGKSDEFSPPTFLPSKFGQRQPSLPVSARVLAALPPKRAPFRRE
jgi:hypothetical protein